MEPQLGQSLPELVEQSDVVAEGVFAKFAELPWFADMDRLSTSWVRSLTRTQVRYFLTQLSTGEMPDMPRVAFMTMPPAAGVQVSLEQSTELLHHACQVILERCGELTDIALRTVIRSEVERYTREMAFSLARIYARAAERRGANEAERHGLLLADLIAGVPPDQLAQHAHRLTGLDGQVRAFALLPVGEPVPALDELRARVRRAFLPFAGSVHSGLILAVTGDNVPRLRAVLPGLAYRRLVIGSAARSIAELGPAVAEVLATARVEAAYPGPSPDIAPDELLLERAMSGDRTAIDRLVGECVTTLAEAGGDLLGR